MQVHSNFVRKDKLKASEFKIFNNNLYFQKMINYEAKMYRTGVYKRTITFRKSFFLKSYND